MLMKIREYANRYTPFDMYKNQFLPDRKVIWNQCIPGKKNVLDIFTNL